MTPRYDLLVIDLDGTLLNREGNVSVENRCAVRRAQDAGIEVVIATGRAWSESRASLEAIGHDGVMIAASGSLLCESRTGRTLDRRVLPRDVVVEATDALVRDGHKVLVLKDAHVTGYDYVAVGDGELDPASQWWFERMGVEVRHVETAHHDPHPEDSVRAGAVACSARLGPLAGRLRDAMAGRCFLQHWSAVTESHATGSSTHLLEIFSINVNKWTMVERYCLQRGIDPVRVAAIGDGLNDVELIRGAGLGIAMANAGPEVAAVAQRTTANHDADGVCHAIDRIVLGEW